VQKDVTVREILNQRFEGRHTLSWKNAVSPREYPKFQIGPCQSKKIAAAVCLRFE
jgi:hypothetical protein